MINIYNLDDASFNDPNEAFPEYIKRNVDSDGYYTLIAIDSGDEEEYFAGALQFSVDMTKSGKFFSILRYIYVVPKYRLLNVALRLFAKAEEILTSEDIAVISANFPYNEEGELISDISEEEIDAFLEGCGFIWTKDTKGAAGYFKFIRR